MQNLHKVQLNCTHVNPLNNKISEGRNMRSYPKDYRHLGSKPDFKENPKED
jgi:hypothetical protein